MPRIEVEVEEMSFDFLCEADWMANARTFFCRSGLTSESTICVDTLGRICISGKEFKRAQDEGAYPVRVYVIPAYSGRLSPCFARPAPAPAAKED